MHIVIAEPYLAGSHAAWAEKYSERSRHEVTILGLPGRHWKWRMHGGAITLARMFDERGYTPDLILVTDMLDLATFIALTRTRTAGIPAVLYFHENQVSYPWSGEDPDTSRGRDVHYGFINLTSALAADVVVFNSEYHRNAFLAHLEPFLRAFPDCREIGSIKAIEAKSHVLHLGLDLSSFDAHRVEQEAGRPPLVLWNHRWEYDKNPDEFFHALFRLKDEGIDFEVAVLGETYSEAPSIFGEAHSRLADRIVQFGYAEDFADYASWLWKADIVPVTSIQDFFGASVVEALYCGCCPVLPRRLAYPEHLSVGESVPGTADAGCDAEQFFYEGFDGLLAMLRNRILDIRQTRKIQSQPFVRRYDWSVVGPEYDAFLEGICNSP